MEKVVDLSKSEEKEETRRMITRTAPNATGNWENLKKNTGKPTGKFRSYHN